MQALIAADAQLDLAAAVDAAAAVQPIEVRVLRVKVFVSALVGHAHAFTAAAQLASNMAFDRELPMHQPAAANATAQAAAESRIVCFLFPVVVLTLAPLLPMPSAGVGREPGGSARVH